MAVLAYWRFLGVWWAQDDYLYLFAAANGDVVRSLLLTPPGHFPLTWNAIRWLAFQTSGPNPLPLTTLLVGLHALNSALIAAIVARRVDHAAGVAAGCAWAVASSHSGTLGFIAAGGNTLATAASLAFLLLLPTARYLALGVLAVIAATSHGSGLSLLAPMPVVILLLSPRGGRRLAVLVGGLTLLLGVCFVIAQGGAHSILRPEFAARMAPRPIEDATTVVHLAWGLAMAAVRTLPAWPIVLVLILGGAWFEPRRAAAFLLLAVSAILAVAIGRAPGIRMGFPVAMATQVTRYYYVPQAFLVVAAGLGLAAVPPRVRSLLAVVTPLALSAVLLREPRLPPPSEEGRVAQALARIPQSAPRGIVDNGPFEPVELLQAFAWPRRLFPGLAGAYVVFGNRAGVRFRARDGDEYEAVQRGGRIAQLLLPPNAGPR